MNRRAFVTGVAAGVLAAPLAARAQQPKMRIIGFLGANTALAQA